MNCQVYRDIVAAHVDEALSAEELLDVASHLDHCSACTRIFSWEHGASRMLKQKRSTIAIPASLKNKISERLNGKPSWFPWQWFDSGYGIAATVALLVPVVIYVLVPKGNGAAGLFADAIVQHTKLAQGIELPAKGAATSIPPGSLDLTPWGYRLLARQPARVRGAEGTTAFYATADKDYVVAQEIKSSRLTIPTGTDSTEISGKIFASHSQDGVNLIAWKDKETLCILASRLPQKRLLSLARRVAASG